MSGRTHVPVEDRFMEKVIPEPNSGCWLWTAGCNNKGYGDFDVGVREVSAHRFSYELFKGPIPKGMFVCHKCDVPSCVNPEHLFLGDQRANLQDASKKGRLKKIHPAMKALWATPEYEPSRSPL
jgi:HNH endonuclease